MLEERTKPQGRSQNIFCKELDSKYFRDCRPHIVIFLSPLPSFPPSLSVPTKKKKKNIIFNYGAYKNYLKIRLKP